MTLIVLPGSLGLLEGAETAVAALACDRQVALHTYESQPDFERALSAVAEHCLNTPEGKADLLGFSFGGWLAQEVARRFPERVRKLILAHTFVMEARYAWRFELAVRAWQLVPDRLLRRLIKRRSQTAFEVAYPRDSAKLLELLAQVDVLSRSPGFLDLLLNQQRWMAQSLRPDRKQSASPEVPRAVMIIDSDNDPIVSADERSMLRAAYPEAEKRCFTGTGHSSALVSPAKFAAAVEEFLAS